MVDEADKAAPDRPSNDRSEGILRDPVRWKDQTVSYVRDVGSGDMGFDANKRHVVIALPDGSTKVVPESEIMRERARAPEATHELDRPGTAPKKPEGEEPAKA